MLFGLGNTRLFMFQSPEMDEIEGRIVPLLTLFHFSTSLFLDLVIMLYSVK